MTEQSGRSLPAVSEVTTAGTAKARAMMSRADAWRTARTLLTEEASPEWSEGLDPWHVLALARFLDGQKAS